MSCCGSQITNAKILELLFIIAPQFATTDPIKLAEYEAMIGALRCMINEKALGCCATLAFANLLAHYLTVQSNPSLGIATNLTEGQLSIGLSSTSSNGNFFYSTPYGQAYLALISRYKLGAYVTNSRRGFYGEPCCGSGQGFGP